MASKDYYWTTTGGDSSGTRTAHYAHKTDVQHLKHATTSSASSASSASTAPKGTPGDVRRQSVDMNRSQELGYDGAQFKRTAYRQQHTTTSVGGHLAAKESLPWAHQRTYGSHDSLHTFANSHGLAGAGDGPEMAGSFTAAAMHPSPYPKTSTQSSVYYQGGDTKDSSKESRDPRDHRDSMPPPSSAFQRGEPSTSSISSLNSMRPGPPWSGSGGRGSSETSPRLKKKMSMFATKESQYRVSADSTGSQYNYNSAAMPSGAVLQQQQQHPILAAKQSKSLFKKLRGVSGREEHSGEFASDEPISAWSTSTSSSLSLSSSSGAVNAPLASTVSSSMSSSTTAVSSHSSVKSTQERQRRKFFLHHDIDSVLGRLVPAGDVEQEQQNVATGASAASAALRGGANQEKTASIVTDFGDNISNSLVLSCPYFRNEIGGERERRIYLARSMSGQPAQVPPLSSLHCPVLARGFSTFNSAGYWSPGYCPYVSQPRNVIEMRDVGAGYFKQHFVGNEHQAWLGVDDQFGPVAISLMRDRVVPSSPAAPDAVSAESGSVAKLGGGDQFIYRVIIRTSSLLSIRGSVPEDVIGPGKVEKLKNLPAGEVIEFVCPEISSQCLRLANTSGQFDSDLMRLDEAYIQNKYKVGMMYCRKDQQSEEEMYNNEHGSAAFNEFLDVVGQRVRLKGFEQYKAGLCNKHDSTGQYSVYRQFEGNEIMFHVSTLLPFTPNNRQQLPRKRYIGNDIVTVVFQEQGSKPFIPNIKSQFQHVFIVVRVENACSENTRYRVAVSRSKSVPLFGPPIPAGAIFKKNQQFANFLLTKIINAENAAHRSDKFASMAVRTRKELLKDLISTYATQTSMETGSKLSMLLGKKKEKTRPRFSPDLSSLCGALSWKVVVEDCSVHGSDNNLDNASSSGHVHLTSEVEALLAVSADTILIERDQAHHEVLFMTAVNSIIGWTATHKSIRIYFHQGEAVIIHSKDPDSDDMLEIGQTLKAASQGAATQEFSLRRNQLGQLGFHVQHDGLVTEVESFGYAWQTGLRQGSRLVEINKFPVSAITHEHMVELLKTSMSVSVTVIPPHPNGLPRRGCHIVQCPFAFGSTAGGTAAANGKENPAATGKQQLQHAGEPMVGDAVLPSTASKWYGVEGSTDCLPEAEENGSLLGRSGGSSSIGDEHLVQPKTPASYTHPSRVSSVPLNVDDDDDDDTYLTIGVPHSEDPTKDATKGMARVGIKPARSQDGYNSQDIKDSGDSMVHKRLSGHNNRLVINGVRGVKTSSSPSTDSSLQQELIRLIAPQSYEETAPPPPTTQSESTRNGKSLDWNTLVRKANEAETSETSSPKLRESDESTAVAPSDVTSQALLERVMELESKVSTQSKENVMLQNEVESLRAENLRLQEESETASQQLKKFTEWFFQAIEKKEEQS